jgi:uncharacterized membrane protein HdeD (DUF308 family)
MVNLKEKMKKIRKYMPLIVGIFWIIGGLGKFVASSFVSEMLKGFAQTCIIPFYAEIIRNFVVPNSFLIVLLFGFLEILCGILILTGKIFARIGLILAIILNILFLPLQFPFTFILSAPLIALQGSMYLHANLETNYFLKLFEILKSKEKKKRK